MDIVLKQDQGTARLVKGRVKRVLTNKSYHSRGIKVELYDGKIGRVQKIINGVINKEVLVESVCTSSNEFRHLRKYHRESWDRLLELQRVPNVVYPGRFRKNDNIICMESRFDLEDRAVEPI